MGDVADGIPVRIRDWRRPRHRGVCSTVAGAEGAQMTRWLAALGFGIICCCTTYSGGTCCADVSFCSGVFVPGCVCSPSACETPEAP